MLGLGLGSLAGGAITRIRRVPLLYNIFDSRAEASTGGASSPSAPQEAATRPAATRPRPNRRVTRWPATSRR